MWWDVCMWWVNELQDTLTVTALHSFLCHLILSTTPVYLNSEIFNFGWDAWMKEAKYAHAVLVEWIEMQISNLDISIFVDSRRKLYLIDFIDSKYITYKQYNINNIWLGRSGWQLGRWQENIGSHSKETFSISSSCMQQQQPGGLWRGGAGCNL